MCTCSSAYGQGNSDARGSGSAPENGAQSVLYKQALEKFRGPSHVYILDAEKTGLSVWTSPIAREERGVILDWNDDRLVLVRSDSLDAMIQPTTRVVRIEPTWENETAAMLHDHFVHRRFAEAIALGSKVLGSKSTAPKWQQRILLAELVESLIELGRWEKGAALFVSLARESPPSLLASVIPIPWMDSTAELKDRKAIQSQAAQWINDPNEYIRLMGACWLLDSDARTDAIQRLEELGKNAKIELVRQYAQSQLWRTIPPQELVGAGDRQSVKHEKCIALRDSIFPPAQAGPTFLLAERLSRGGASELAVQEWLRVVLIHPNRRSMAIQSGKSVKLHFQTQSNPEKLTWIDNELKRLENTLTESSTNGLGRLIPTGDSR